jgi:hypothetical protein
MAPTGMLPFKIVGAAKVGNSTIKPNWSATSTEPIRLRF